MLTLNTPARRLAALWADYIGDDTSRFDQSVDELLEDLTDGLPGNRFLLIEENAHGGHHFSLHDTPEDAGDYHVNQEYAGDWDIVDLVDLETGNTFTPTTTVTFVADTKPEPMPRWRVLYKQTEYRNGYLSAPTEEEARKLALDGTFDDDELAGAGDDMEIVDIERWD